MKRVYIKTYGCQMQVYDSSRMAEMFGGLPGYEVTETPAQANVAIFNGCSIRAKAVNKVYSDMGKVRKNNPSAVIVLAGCTGQGAGKEAFSRGVNIIVGPRSYHKLPELLDDFHQNNHNAFDFSLFNNEKFEDMPIARAQSAPSVFLTVQEGCNKTCKYCSVPQTRGPEFSRPTDQILTEARQLIENGAREIMLLGQNVNAYRGRDDQGKPVRLTGLISRIAALNGLKRVRYMTSHPLDMTPDLVAMHGDLKQLMPHLHLPVQSGSDRILKHMNRHHTAAHYLNVIAALRKARPGICFSTDLMVGYPEETDADFEDTLALVREVKFSQIYSFKYSPRSNTPAADMPQIAETIKDARLQQLQALGKEQQNESNRSFVGKRLDVLLNKAGKRAGQATGFSEHMHPVVVEGATDLIGRIVPVQAVGLSRHTLQGELIGEREKIDEYGTSQHD